MTVRHLVSEARPIRWHHLSPRERELLVNEADRWLIDVMADARKPKASHDEIDDHRNGRVLFIDGQRGSGKTSMLLTLLEGWMTKGYPRYRDVVARPHPILNLENVHILFPILDFDPLPRGMPLHGWLLEPWRKKASSLDETSAGGPSAKDLSELLAEVFDRVVTGWAHVAVEGKGVVEQAIAYQEKASGWIDTPREWRAFVNQAVCRSSRCSAVNCKSEHPIVFVVAIDDVDLQVEHIPQLLQAIRLLHHPNVVYVLTGDYGHLQFAVLLDYLHRHERLAHGQHGYSGHEGSVDAKTQEEIALHSRRLRDAFLEKALPQHARIKLEALTLDEILQLTIPNQSSDADRDSQRLESIMTNPIWHKIAKLMHGRRVAPVRKAQHVIDRLTGGVDQYAFVADLCNAESPAAFRGPRDDSDDNSYADRWQFSTRGRLTTRLGSILRAWNGDQLTILLADQPTIEYQPDWDEADTRVEEEAHRALLVHLVSQEDGAPAAHALEWMPDDGIVVTQVVWTPRASQVEGTAVFHWPWLTPPPAAHALHLGTLSRMMSELAKGHSLGDHKDSMVIWWLLANIEWFTVRMRSAAAHAAQFPDIPQLPKDLKLAEGLSTWGEFISRLIKIKTHDDACREEVERWVSDLYVMSAPYLGLPASLRENLRNALAEVVDKSALVLRLFETEATMVGDAIVARRPSGRKPRPLKDGETQHNKLIQQFIDERKNRTHADEWWTLREQSEAPQSVPAAVVDKGKSSHRQ